MENCFLYFSWHAFCWWRLWNNGHYLCENSLEEVQGATTSSHIPPPLLQDPWPAVYSSCMRSAMLHASETWPLTKTNLQRNDRAMIRQICSIKPEDVATVRSSELLAKLELEDLYLILRERTLCWFGHVECSSVLVVQSEKLVIYRLMGGREPKVNMEETDGERLPWVEAHHSWPSRKEHLEIRCEICYACS